VLRELDKLEGIEVLGGVEKIVSIELCTTITEVTSNIDVLHDVLREG
jgi:hypothetical protein